MKDKECVAQTREEVMGWMDFAIQFLEDGDIEVAKSYLYSVKKAVSDG